MCDYFTIRQQRMFPSYTIDVKEQAKIDRFLQLLNTSGVAIILDSVKNKDVSSGAIILAADLNAPISVRYLDIWRASLSVKLCIGFSPFAS